MEIEGLYEDTNGDVVLSEYEAEAKNESGGEVKVKLKLENGTLSIIVKRKTGENGLEEVVSRFYKEILFHRLFASFLQVVGCSPLGNMAPQSKGHKCMATDIGQKTDWLADLKD